MIAQKPENDQIDELADDDVSIHSVMCVCACVSSVFVHTCGCVCVCACVVSLELYVVDIAYVLLRLATETSLALCNALGKAINKYILLHAFTCQSELK